MKTKAAAVLTIRRAADMSKRGKRDVVKWLRYQADLLNKHANEYAPGFRARYLYR